MLFFFCKSRQNELKSVFGTYLDNNLKSYKNRNKKQKLAQNK